MADISKCQEKLLALAEQQGYLTYDNIIEAADSFSLSVSDVDLLSEAIQLRNIIVYETAPVQNTTGDSDEELLDYSRTDYDAIFSEIIKLAPQLQSFVEEVKGCPIPQYGETRQLILQSTAGNQYARERLISIYLRNALKLALSMTKQYDFDLEEAVSASVMGLVTAVDRFDPAGFSGFSSYASLWMQQNIQRNCKPIWMDYYFPVHSKDKMIHVMQKYRECTRGEEPGTAEYDVLMKKIAFATDLEVETVEKCIMYSLSQQHGKLSIDNWDKWNDDEKNDFENVVKSNEDLVVQDVVDNALKKEISLQLDTLDEREKTILKMRMGIDCDHAMTLEEIGNIINLSRERVRQIEAKALRKMRNPSRSKRLRGYL